MKHLNWHSLIIVGTLPAAVMGVLCFFFLNESAFWLALQGKVEKARTVLETIRWWNRKEHISLDFAAPDPVKSEGGFEPLRQQLEVAFGPVLWFTTVALCYSTFVLNFVYYGCFYSFPVVLGNVDMGVSPALALVLGCLWELPGYAAAAFLGTVLGRRSSTLLYLVLMILSIVMFVEGAKRQKNSNFLYQYCLHAGFGGLKCWINTGFIIVYQYVPEIYPTSCRVCGAGLCLGVGRFGSMLAPFVFEWSLDTFNGSWQPFFSIMAIICGVNIVLIMFLPFETWGMTLKDHVEEMGEREPLYRKMVVQMDDAVQCVERPSA
jgi:hypothetical protein